MAGDQKATGATNQRTVLGVAQGLLAGAAVAGAVIYVLMNALYIEFYDDFGVRPEEVGLDRLAVLGRAGVLAIIALVFLGPIVVGITWVSTRQIRYWQPISLSIVALVGIVLIVIAFVVVRWQVEDRADGVFQCREVRGIQFFAPFKVDVVNVRAHYAKVAWIEDKEKMPSELKSFPLMYLGQGPRVAAFVSCSSGTTVIVPADHVSVCVIIDPGVSSMC